MKRFLTFTAMLAASYTAILTAFNPERDGQLLETPAIVASLGVIAVGLALELKRKLSGPKTAKARA